MATMSLGENADTHLKEQSELTARAGERAMRNAAVDSKDICLLTSAYEGLIQGHYWQTKSSMNLSDKTIIMPLSGSACCGSLKTLDLGRLYTESRDFQDKCALCVTSYDGSSLIHNSLLKLLVVVFNDAM